MIDLLSFKALENVSLGVKGLIYWEIDIISQKSLQYTKNPPNWGIFIIC